MTTAWLIERYINSGLTYWYWCGHSLGDFRPDHSEAVRFARFDDGARVLAWLLGGFGRVVEHAWEEP